jgi:hypothetical protein
MGVEITLPSSEIVTNVAANWENPRRSRAGDVDKQGVVRSRATAMLYGRFSP